SWSQKERHRSDRAATRGQSRAGKSDSSRRSISLLEQRACWSMIEQKPMAQPAVRRTTFKVKQRGERQMFPLTSCQSRGDRGKQIVKPTKSTRNENVCPSMFPIRYSNKPIHSIPSFDLILYSEAQKCTQINLN